MWLDKYRIRWSTCGDPASTPWSPKKRLSKPTPNGWHEECFPEVNISHSGEKFKVQRLFWTPRMFLIHSYYTPEESPIQVLRVYNCFVSVAQICATRAEKKLPLTLREKKAKKVSFSSNNDTTRRPISYPRHYWIRTYYTLTESPDHGLQFHVFVLCLRLGSKRCKPTKEGAIFANFGHVWKRQETGCRKWLAYKFAQSLWTWPLFLNLVG